ncbi:MAG TPA: serine hydrolase domain-containing protein [Xanthomonadales bacterium]|nr:serine hydrolase domain-containing protein [Xanthomonadales bacterium]
MSIVLLALLSPIVAAHAAAPVPVRASQRPVPVPVAVPGVARVPGDDALVTKRLVADFDRLADQAMATGQIVGLATVVVHNGQVVSRRGLGVRDTSAPQPVTTDTVFRLASLSKAFASTLTALLVDDGFLGWELHVQDLVPAFELSDTREAPKVTVADLLSHRVGLPHNAEDMTLEQDESYPMLVYRLRDVPLVCPPGDCYAYQNVAFSLIGDIVFATTGDFYYHQVERRLFHPLGMKTATYGRDSLEASVDWARPHVRRGKRWQSVRPKETYYRVPPAAGVNASISDMTEWLLAQLGHRPDVLPPALLELTHAPLVSTPGEIHGSALWRRERLLDAQYAMGWRVYDYGGHRLVFHAGAVQGYRAMIALLPDHDFGAVLLWNNETGVPAGLLPTLLDGFLGMPARDWLQLRRIPRVPVYTAAAAAN